MCWLLLFLLAAHSQICLPVTLNYETFRHSGGDRGIILKNKDDNEQEMRFYDPSTETMLDDMIITKSEFRRMTDPEELKRNGLIDPEALWPHRTLRYFIDREFNKRDKQIIRAGIKMITNNSCVRFEELHRPPNDDRAYVHINSLNGCFSRVGAKCTKCQMSLSTAGCLKPGTIAHEFLHALGFYHMQCSGGRNNYVTIMWENMSQNERKNFVELGDTTTLLNTPYDYDSILHYGANFFSVNGKPTIVPKDKRYMNRIGQRERLSDGDIKRLNVLYKC